MCVETFPDILGACWRDAQHRAGRRDRSGALVGREPPEPGRDILVHPGTVVTATYPQLTCGRGRIGLSGPCRPDYDARIADTCQSVTVGGVQSVRIARSSMSRRRGPLLLAIVAALGLLVPSAAIAGRPAPSTTIQFLNVSDWHGNLDPVSGVGGAWNISARWQADRAAYPTLTLTAGDDFGATPPLSGFFDEAPSVLAQRLMGIQVGALGNHNFDAGIDHLQRMIDLAGSPTSADAPGAPFGYVAANLKNLSGNLAGVDPVKYFRVGGAKIAVIGITNEEAPSVVAPGSLGTIVPTDGVAAANKFARIARRNGSNVVIVITHKGVRGFTNGAPFGELVDFANGVNGVDVIFGDHTDVQWSGTIHGALVHENRSFGVTYAKTLVTLQNGAVTDKSVTFVNPTAGTLSPDRTQCATGFCDQAVVDMLVPYRRQLSALLDGTIGTSAATFARGGNIERRQEVPLGDLITDGMRWKYGTDIGFMSGGGIRSTLPAAGYTPADTTLRRPTAGYQAGPPYDLVKGDVFTVLPFGNVVVTRSVTGAQLWAALENGVSRIDACGLGTDGRFPQISGFKFTFNYDLPAGARVVSVALTDGTPIPNSASSTYTMALPNFTNSGGDSYAMFADGQGTSRDLDASVMLDYMLNNGPAWDPAGYPASGRITKQGTPCP